MAACCPIGRDVGFAAGRLRAGALVAFATETVYGLGADALDVRAVARVFEVKGRPTFDPLIVHVADTASLDGLIARWPEAAARLAERFWPGPLTLVLPKTDRVPDLVTAGLPSVAVRVPAHPLALELIRAAGVPVAAPSANPFGRISPTRAEHVAEQLGERIDYILDGGPCRVGVESTVLDLSTAGTEGTAELLRPGGVPVEELEEVIGPIRRPPAHEPAHDETARDADTARRGPGMLTRHYAPRTPLVIAAGDGGGAASREHRRVGRLAFRAIDDPDRFAAVEVLSPAGDLREAAANLFAAMRRLDAAGLDLIVADRFPETGLGHALNDRLRRAAAG
jgi:L-threonylcarbamoyladenylate synthase